MPLARFVSIISIPLLSFLFSSSLAQEAIKPRPSPMSAITMKYKDAYVKIVYSQPHKNNRAIFGALVPYGQVWRTGANEATEITTTKDIQINGTLLKAGTYSIFTMPEKDHWIIIINSEIGLWGSYNYNSKFDVMRFNTPIQTLSGVIYEPFTMSFDQKNEVANLLMMWDNVKVIIPVKFIN